MLLLLVYHIHYSFNVPFVWCSFICPDPLNRCIDDRLTSFYTRSAEFNALIQHYGQSDDPAASFIPLNQRFIPYVGNGWFGLEVATYAKLHVKYGRYLSYPINYHPIVSIADEQNTFEDTVNEKDSVVVDYLNGIVHQFQCFRADFFVSHNFYGELKRNTSFGLNKIVNVYWFFEFAAHRVVPQVFVQEIRITNTKNTVMDVQLLSPSAEHWAGVETKNLK